MKIGVFMMPGHPPGRDYAEGHYHNLDYLEFLDKAGCREAWIGEHYTVRMEPLPSPDLLIAQAILQTQNLILCTGAFLLPYHHPAELAHRIAWLDRISRGRLIVGIGAGGVPTDWAMFDVDGMAGQNREMTEESLEIMLKLWQSSEPFEYRGKFWVVRRPEPDLDGVFNFHLTPHQQPYPPIAVAGFSPKSPSLHWSGLRGFIPVSISYSDTYLASQWDAYSLGAAAANRIPLRSNWRVGRDIYIASSESEAWEKTVNGSMGDFYRNYFLPFFKKLGALSACKHHPDVADSDVTVEYLAKHCWIVGTPETVTDKIGEMLQSSGGFGTLLAISYDHLDNLQGWRESISALTTEVAPKFESV
ncbi:MULTISPECIES: LLM class flavin-dependent oxidoreductase [unclassified Microcoleus]|uniref:LLM class flavin-dependent oxidoreductase n=1 Tax=unclassified Microcoleus TaxID=2642155 RepID=UPI002FD04ADF